MADTILGKIAITPKGAYAALTPYERLDAVSYNGSSWLVLKDCTGVIPIEGEFYTQLAGKGDKGDSAVYEAAVLAGYIGTQAQWNAAMASMNSGTPKGVYTTVSALTSAKPTGDTGIYVVTADGKWYYWNGTAWTAGTLYLETISNSDLIQPGNLNKYYTAEEKAAIQAKISDNVSNIKAIEETLVNVNPNAETRLTQTSYERVVSLPLNTGEGGLKSVIGGNTLKNETTYSRDTWAEWTKNSDYVCDSTGVEVTLRATWTNITLPTSFKASTKYGFLYEVVSNTITTDVLFGAANSPFNFTISKSVDNNKVIATSLSSFVTNAMYVNFAPGATDQKIKLKNIRVFELPAGSQIETDFTNLTANQLAMRYPYIDGAKSVIAPRVRSVGKNLVKSSEIELGYINTTSGVNNIDLTKIRTGFTKVKSGVSYFAKATDIMLSGLYAYDKNKNFISANVSGFIESGTFGTAFTVKSNVAYLRNTLRRTVGTEFITAADLQKAKDTFQIEANTVATSFETYKESFLYPEPKSLMSVPNGVADSLENGTLIQRVKEYTLQASDITTLNMSFVNLDYALIKKPLDYEGCYTIEKNLANVLLDGYTHGTVVDAVDSINKISPIVSTTHFAIGFSKGKYVNLDAVKTALTGIKIIYQLVTPIITENVTSGIPISYPSGSIFLEPVLADAGVYTDKMSILLTAFPIASLESIKKINAITGEETPLSVSTAVINTNKLSFTHPSLVLGDIVFFTYFYAETGCYGRNTYNYFDSRYVKVDSVTGIYYKLDFSIANGVPSIDLVEVV